MTNLPKLRAGSRWLNSREIIDEAGDGVRLIGVRLIEVDCDDNNRHVAYNSDVLALLDANGINTTANELRKELNELREKINAAFDFIEMCHRKDAMDVLREALDKP